MGFLRFLGRHLLASFLGALGIITMVLGYADQAADIWATVQPWQLQAGGAMLFVLAIILILYKWDQEQQHTASAPASKGRSEVEPERRRAKAEPAPKGLSSPPPPAPLAAAETDKSKVILGANVTADSLMAAARDKTALHADRAVGMYIGKWIKVTGIVDNISDHGETLHMCLDVPIDYKGTKMMAPIWLEFPGDRDRLEITHHGDQITALGRIKRITGATMELGECSLI